MKSNTRSIVCLFVAVTFICLADSLGAAEGAGASTLRAGAAAIDITPTRFPVIVNGMFEQRTAAVAHDRLMSRALVLDDGKQRLAIVVVDNLMIPRRLLDLAKQQAAQATGIPANRILISATHTHSAPSVMGCLGSGSDPAYTQFLPDQITKSIVEATRNLVPAQVGWAVVTDDQHNHCRRWIFRPDRMPTDPFGQRNVRAHMHPGHMSQNHVGPSGPADTDLTLLSVQTRDGKPLAVLANYAMHYYGSPLVSGDFCGRFGLKLADLIGATNQDPPLVGIMSQGTSGDSMWPDYSRPARRGDLDAYTAAVASVAQKAYQTISYRTDVSLAMAETTLKLRRRVPDPQRLAWARKTVAGIGDRLPRGFAQVYAREQIYLHEEPEVELKLQAIRIGDLGITAIPDEVYGITGLKLKARSPLQPTFNIELANGAEGYIPPPEQHKLGGYTTWPARTAGLEVEAEPKIVAALVRLLEEVSGKPQRALTDPQNDYSQVVLASRPAAFWRLGEIEGSQASDATGKHHGRYEDGVAFYLPSFDTNPKRQQEGSDADPSTARRVGVPNHAAHFAGGRVKADVKGLGNTYSVECWIWNGLPNNARAVTGYFFSRGPDGDKNAAGDHLGIGGTYKTEWTGKLIVFNGNEQDEVLVGRTDIKPKTWNHVALARDGRRVTVYLNGGTQPEIDGELTVSYPEDCSQMFLGGRNDGLFNFEGKLDEFALYDRALSSDEVAAHFAAAGAQQTSSVAAKPAETLVLRTPNPPPQSPPASLKLAHVREGFELELVAAEPLVVDPVAIDWSPDGKLWVAEMADYPLGMDGQGKPGGRIRFLEDSDGDGRYDRSTLFLDDVNFPTGILSWGKGVLVTAAPEIFYAEDSDGDGKADVRRTLFSGFLEGNQQLRVNGLRPGLDNWVYCASGSHHAGYGKESRIKSHLTGELIQVGSRDFRIRPDKGLLDPQSGPSQFGRNRDDWGNWFGVQNSYPLWHYVLADQDIRRNPHFAPPDPRHQVVIPANPRVYPAKDPQKRFHSFDQSGRFTSACSAMIYRDELFAKTFNRAPTGSASVDADPHTRPDVPAVKRTKTAHAFTCEPFHNLVQHNVITDDGVSFRSYRDPAEANRDFFASEDRWCRPVMVRTGPDGALWVVDMYRYMIEHPQWLPKEGQDELRPFYRAGDDRGRIYRIFPKGSRPRAIPRLDTLTPEQLVAALEGPNGWQRDTVQRLLISKKDPAVVTLLTKLALSSQQPLARLHTLCTLDGLDALTTETLEEALGDQHPGVRRHAVRLSAGRSIDVSRLLPLVNDHDAKVRLQLACTLGRFDDPRAGSALAELGVANANDPYIIAAVMSSLNKQNIAQVLASALAITQSVSDDQGATSVPRPRDQFVSQVFTQVAAMGGDKIISDAVNIACTPTAGRYEPWQLTSLAEMLDVLAKRSWPVDQRLAEPQRTALTRSIEQARMLAADAGESEKVRAAAVRLLLRQPDNRADDLDLLQRLLVPQTPSSVQQAIVSHAAGHADKKIASVLLGGWKSHSPASRAQILSVLASRGDWVETLLDNLESSAVLPSEIDASMRQRLLATQDNSMRARLQKVLATASTADRKNVIAQYETALRLDGDAVRGEAVFRQRCANCHRQGQIGHEVGPNLASLTDKTPRALLTSILDPSAAVEAKYLNYIVITAGGRSLSGMLVSETGSSITLLAAEGRRESILRSDIDELQSTSKSLMPDGLEKDLTPQDLSDLIAFVRGNSSSNK